MHKHFIELLPNAEGRSEYIIAVFADIRGFSSFCEKVESPDTAMYLKRVYKEIINTYFDNATFYKAIGDGLLIIYTYNEYNLLEVAERVLISSYSCLYDFSEICKDDPMINFPVPNNIGLGISRGTACCLFSGDEIIDYSGRILNVAARLQEIARPLGIVIDGQFGKETISEIIREDFEEAEVFLPGIAEKQSRSVFYLETHVELPEYALSQIVGDQWLTEEATFLVRDLPKVGPIWRVRLDYQLKETDKIKVRLTHPRMKSGRVIEDILTNIDFPDYEYECVADEPAVLLKLERTHGHLKSIRVPGNREIKFTIKYVPRLR